MGYGITTSAVFWGRADLVVPTLDACFFCGRRLSMYCGGCSVAVCALCNDPRRASKLKPTHAPEAHRDTRQPIVPRLKPHTPRRLPRQS